MKMTIGKKLTLGFGSVLVFMFAVTLFSVTTYLKTVKDYEDFTEKRVHQLNLVRGLEVETKVQVKEWKNILLKGQDASKRVFFEEKYNKQIEEVRKDLERLKNGPDHIISEENKKLLVQFEEEYKNLNAKYAEALKSYMDAAGINLAEVDAKTTGIDQRVLAIVEKISSKTMEYNSRLIEEQSQKARWLGVMVAVIASIVFILGIFLAMAMVRSITDPLKILMLATKRLAGADLRQEIDIKSDDEIGELANSFQLMVDGLKGILIKVQGSTGQITSASNEILAASQQQASAAREQSSAVAETSAAAKELSATSEQVGESIKRVAQVAGHAMAGMAKIKDSIEKTNTMLTSLGEKSQKIGRITELIDDVADQTNLLAVNASIEAARAGEQGRGFTVVADEIRKLADSTAKSTKDITSLIELIQHEMSNAIMSMEQSVQSVDEEARLAQQTTEKTKEIAMSTHQQISGSKQISDAMMSIDEAMKQIASGAQQSQASVKQLTELASELKQLASKFKL